MKTEHTERRGAKGLIIALLLAVSMIMGVAASSEARLASTNRHAAVIEAYYALSPDHTGFTSKLINGNVVGVWNYLDSDHNAYENVKVAYPKPNASTPSLWPIVDQNIFYDNSPQIGYANLKRYWMYNNSTKDGYGPVGRGGQCKFFIDTLLFRSEASVRILNDPKDASKGQYVLPTYTVMSNSTRSSGYAKPGDVIFIANNGHTALVVAVLAGNSDAGTVTEVDVIDSNFIGYDGNEMIARHRLKVNYDPKVKDTSKLQNYSIYTGVSYYNEPYYPW